MMAQTHFQKEKLIQDVWGVCCMECDSTKTPDVHVYNLKKEDVAVITCPSCGFTIVVVEIEKLYKNDLKEELKEDSNQIVTTYNAL